VCARAVLFSALFMDRLAGLQREQVDEGTDFAQLLKVDPE
jgi:hypothetical protein